MTKQELLRGVIVHCSCLSKTIERTQQLERCVLPEGAVIGVLLVAEASRRAHVEPRFVNGPQHECFGDIQAPKVQAKWNREHKQRVVSGFGGDRRVNTVGIEITMKNLAMPT